MPRRALITITLLVLALHWLVLGGVPLGGTDEGAAQSQAFHTRMVTLPPAQPTPVEPAAAAPPPAKPAPAPKPKPAPRPKPRPEPAPQSTDDETVAQANESLAPDTAAHDEGASSAEAGSETGNAPETPAAPASEPIAAVAAASEPASAAVAAAAPPVPAPSPDNDLSAGVDIRPPGAAGGLASTDAPPVKLPASVTLSYAVIGEVKKLGYNVNGELAWKTDGTNYEAKQGVSAFLLGTRSQTSVGRITEQGLAPTRFGDKGKREQAAHFDYEAHQLIFSSNSQRATFSAGAQDRVSVLIQLAGMFAAAPDRYPTGTQITFTTVGARNADRWTFTVGEPETLELPVGTTRAIKLLKLPRHERDLKAELWLGPQHSYLPVRLKLTQSNGDFADLSLK